jgi:hypothetical protein
MNRRSFLRAATGCAVAGAAPVVALNHEYCVIDLGCYGTPVQKQLVEIFNAALDRFGDELNRQLLSR